MVKIYLNSIARSAVGGKTEQVADRPSTGQRVPLSKQHDVWTFMVCQRFTATVGQTEVKTMTINGSILLRINFRELTVSGTKDDDILRSLSIDIRKIPKTASVPVCIVEYCEHLSAEGLADAIIARFKERGGDGNRSYFVSTEEIMEEFFALHSDVMDAYDVIRDRASACGGYSVAYTQDGFTVKIL